MAKKRAKVKKFSSDEVAAFCEQIAIILNGGIPLYEGTYILYSEMEDKLTKAVLKKIDGKVKESVPFYKALEESEAFPEYMVNMVRIGETTGKLEEVMKGLTKYYERESSMKSGIRSVISYPVILFFMMSVVLSILVIKILPMFDSVFRELDSEAGSSTEHMMEFSLRAGRVTACIVGGVILIIIGMIFWSKTRHGKEALYHLSTVFPFIRKIAWKMDVAKFVSGMSLMVSSGMDTEDALELVLTVVRDERTERKVKRCRKLVTEKMALDEALKETGLITGMHGRMISVGLKTGVLDTVLEKLSDTYDNDIENALAGVSTTLETILVVALCAVIGAILISVMMPLVGIISSIG